MNRGADRSAGRIVRVRAGAGEFALAMSRVAAIEAAERLAHSSWRDGLAGDMNRRGEHIPVYWLSQRLGLENAAALGSSSGRHYVVVLEGESRPWATLVDSVSPVETVPPDRSRPLPAACGDPRELPFSSVLDVEGSPLILELDVDRLHPDRPPYADRRSTFNRRRVAVAPAAPPAVARSESKSATHVLAFIVGAPVEGRETAIAVPMSQVLEIIDPLEVLHTP
ncbi:MAG TPA: chemotaxis protein CheW, partial [Planctomycetia bacterium]|nr:chemotaxis protein CheW [Planctomycetia bacterium]